MKAHDLATALFQGPNVEVVLYVYGHRYSSDSDADSHGRLHVSHALLGRDDTPAEGDHKL